MSYPEKSDALSPPPPYQGRTSQDNSVFDFDPDIKELLSSSSNTKALDLVNTKSHLNIRIADATSGDVLYYVDNSSFTPGKPDVTLSAGSDKNGPVRGVCRWSHMYSKQFTMGLGDPKTDSTNTAWEQVQTESSIHPVFQWSTGLPGARQTFAWHRMKGDDLRSESEDANAWSRKNFKLVDCSTDEVLAVFASYRFKSWSKLGRLTFKADGPGRGWGDGWEIQSILSLLGIVEMSRRRGRQRRNNGGGGGP